MAAPKRKKTGLQWLRNLLCGAFIGAGSILPGVSGGVLAVVFGIYRPFMEILTSPARAIPRYWKIFLPLGIGAAIGFLAFAKGIAAAISFSQTVTVWLFVGLISGTVPSLFREAGREGRSVGSWVSLLVCGLAVWGGLYYVDHVAEITVTPGFLSFALCGLFLGAGVVIPGMSASPLLMALGLYQPLLEGMASLRPLVLLPCLLGIGTAVLLLAKLVTWLYRRYYSMVFHGIIGSVLAATIAIIPTEYGRGEGWMSVLCCIGGFALAFFMSRLDQKLKE